MIGSTEGGNRVVVLGSLNMDLIVRTEHLPGPGETILGGRFDTAAGGKGANQAVAAARLGARVSMVGAVGNDEYGRRLLSNAEADGVDVSHVVVSSEPTGVALIVVDALGQNMIAVAPGANGEVTSSMAEDAAELIRGADVLVAQLETPLDAITTAASIARANDVPFILNAAPARPNLDDLLRVVTVLVVNETELGVLSGLEVTEGMEGTVAWELLDRGPEAVVVTLGARGALVVDRTRSVEIPSYPVVPIDCVGAGDAFVGALASHYTGLRRLEETLRLATAVGALACTKPGAQPSLPEMAEVVEFVEGRIP